MEEKTSRADGREKFGTYYRDSTGQDYADQRYHASGTGSFFTADAYRASTAGQNNGRITQAVDGVANETVNYTYDALNRLAGANATNGSRGQGSGTTGLGT